jgi:hypothetical protein
MRASASAIFGSVALAYELLQRSGFRTRLLERDSRVLADLHLAVKIRLAVAEGPHATQPLSRLRARNDEPPIAHRQSAVAAALAGLERADREVGQLLSLGSSAALLCGIGRHEIRHE